MIKYEDFLKEMAHNFTLIKALDEKLNRNYYGEKFPLYSNGFNIARPLTDDEKKNPSLDETYFLFDSWETGGVEGGSWRQQGGNSHYSKEVVDTDFHSFDKILEDYTDISFLAYKRISKEIILTDSYTVTEYYGNSSDYSCKMVSLEKFFNVLKEENLFKEKYSVDDEPIVKENKPKKTIKAKR